MPSAGVKGGGGTTFSRPSRQYWTGGERAPIQVQQKAEANVTDSRSRSLRCERNTHHTTRDTTDTSPAIPNTATTSGQASDQLAGFSRERAPWGTGGGRAGLTRFSLRISPEKNDVGAASTYRRAVKRHIKKHNAKKANANKPNETKKQRKNTTLAREKSQLCQTAHTKQYVHWGTHRTEN